MKPFGLLAACLTCFASASWAAGVTVAHFEPLQRLSIDDAQPRQQQKPGASVPANLTFDAFGRTFALRLEPNDRLLAAPSRRSLTGGIAIYRGEVAGNPDSWTRIVVADGMPRGLIWDGSELFAVEAPGDSAVQATSAVIYRLADVYVPPGTMSCGTSSGSAAEVFGKLVGELGRAIAKGPGANSQIDLGAIGDFEFAEEVEDPDAAIITRLNNVDGIFSEQLGVQINVAELEIFTDAADPFTDTTSAGTLLDELAEYRLNTQTQRNQGLTHLYTGRNLDGSTVGIAFTNTLCLPSFGSGLTGGGNNATFDSLVAAHEIGHNFGAPHDGEAGSACESETGAFLMSSSVNGSDQFSQCSIDQMEPNVAAASCIFPLATVDLSVDIEGIEPQAFLGSTVSIRFVATNVGTEPATNAEMEIVVPDNVTLSPNQVTQVGCFENAGLLNCPLGTMAGGSFLTASLQFIATSAGTGNFVAAVSADGDSNPNNDVETAQLTVVPAVDLAVNPIAAAQVNLNQGTSVTVELENRSELGATNVELSVLLDSGLRADDATWSLGACTVAARQIECTAVDFASQSSATLAIDLTGTAAGQSSYEVSLTSLEADADTTNNSAPGNVMVIDPSASAGGGGSGGGGATGILSLILLLTAGLVRRPATPACERSRRIDSRHPTRSNTPLARA